MDRFRQNRRQSQQKKQSRQLPGLFSTHSPEKRQQFQLQGAGSSQSPHVSSSRLPEMVLQKQVSAMRKYQQTQQRLRQKQVAYQHLVDMYDKVVKEKLGIEASLMQQIQMYKNLIKQIEQKAQQRLRKIQQAFKDQMQRKLAQKQEQMRIILDQKQQLEKAVEQLQNIGDQLETKLNQTAGELKNTQDNLKKTQDEKRVVQDKLQATQQQAKMHAEKQQQLIDNLKQKNIEMQRQWRDKLDQAGKQKQKALKQQQKQYKQQINKIYQKHQNQKAQRKEQLKNLMEGFQAEKNRLNQMISAKQKAIQQHHRQSKQGSDKLNNAIRGYEQQIQTLATQKARLFQQVDTLNQENTHLNVLVKQLQMNAANQKRNLQSYILKLKQDVNFSQNNFLRERDRNVVHYEDSSKEIITLKRQLAILQAQNQKIKTQSGDSSILANQVRNLRDMLLQSSYQLQKCKQQLLQLSKEKQYMAIRLNQASYEVGTLKRIKNDRQQEARGWRDSYYLNRSRSIRR